MIDNNVEFNNGGHMKLFMSHYIFIANIGTRSYFQFFIHYLYGLLTHMRNELGIHFLWKLNFIFVRIMKYVFSMNIFNS